MKPKGRRKRIRTGDGRPLMGGRHEPGATVPGKRKPGRPRKSVKTPAVERYYVDKLVASLPKERE